MFASHVIRPMRRMAMYQKNNQVPVKRRFNNLNELIQSTKHHRHKPTYLRDKQQTKSSSDASAPRTR